MGSLRDESLVELPIIDISNPSDPSVGKAMVDAAAKYGFLYIDSSSTAFTVEDVDNAFRVSKEFFQQSTDVKAAYHLNGDYKGWSGMHEEVLDPENHSTGDFKEAMDFGEFLDGMVDQPIPPPFSTKENRARLARFASLCRKTCTSILQLLAVGLKLPADFFTIRHDPKVAPTGSTLRFLFYPNISKVPTYEHEKDVRAGAHSDYGSITLLFQRPGQPGLEILTAEGNWVAVPIYPPGQDDARPFPPILINIGDLLNYWTDGLLKSTVHRVIFPPTERTKLDPQDRQSIAYFCQPVTNTELIPVPSKLVEDYRKRNEGKENAGINGFGGGAGSFESGKRALTAEQHINIRLAATYTQHATSQK